MDMVKLAESLLFGGPAMQDEHPDRPAEPHEDIYDEPEYDDPMSYEDYEPNVYDGTYSED